MGERKDPALDEFAIREFLQTHGRRIVAGLSILAGSQAVAEEAVQEALARAWERSERGERIESLAGWVATVATNIDSTRLVQKRMSDFSGRRFYRERAVGSASADANFYLGKRSSLS